MKAKNTEISEQKNAKEIEFANYKKGEKERLIQATEAKAGIAQKVIDSLNEKNEQLKKQNELLTKERDSLQEELDSYGVVEEVPESPVQQPTAVQLTKQNEEKK